MKSLVILSGGQDSTTCLFDAVQRHGAENVYTLTIDYHQRHGRELLSAYQVARMAHVPRHNSEVLYAAEGLLISSSPLVDKSEHLEQYVDHQSLPGGLEKTFVPARNLLFLTLAANRAYALDASEIVIGVSQEDYGGYPDCRAAFIAGTQAAIQHGLDREITIAAPLIFKSKAETVKMALKLPGCYYALAYTHTSYDNEFPPKGKDHATLLRAKGFEKAGVPDPLIVRAWVEGEMYLPDTPNYDICEPMRDASHSLTDLLSRIASAMSCN